MLALNLARRTAELVPMYAGHGATVLLNQVHACVRACVRACVCVCVRVCACVRACVHACMRVSTHACSCTCAQHRSGNALASIGMHYARTSPFQKPLTTGNEPAAPA